MEEQIILISDKLDHLAGLVILEGFLIMVCIATSMLYCKK